MAYTSVRDVVGRADSIFFIATIAIAYAAVFQLRSPVVALIENAVGGHKEFERAAEVVEWLLDTGVSLARTLLATIIGDYLVHIFQGKDASFTVVVAVLGASLLYLAKINVKRPAETNAATMVQPTGTSQRYAS